MSDIVYYPEAKQIFDDANHSGASAGMVRSMVLAFSRKGPDFYEETSFRELSEEEKNKLDAKRKENAELDNKYKKEGKEEIALP